MSTYSIVESSLDEDGLGESSSGENSLGESPLEAIRYKISDTYDTKATFGFVDDHVHILCRVFHALCACCANGDKRKPLLQNHLSISILG